MAVADQQQLAQRAVDVGVEVFANVLKTAADPTA
jgi:hypothetical protein